MEVRAAPAFHDSACDVARDLARGSSWQACSVLLVATLVQSELLRNSIVLTAVLGCRCSSCL